MAGGIRVEPTLLASLADGLTSAGDDLDAAAESIPSPPNAGDLTVAMSEVLARLTASAGQVVIGLRGAGLAVARARDSYVTADQEGADSIAADAGLDSSIMEAF